MQNRRGFLGSILGTLAIAKVPFLAIEEYPFFDEYSSRDKDIIKIFTSPNYHLKRIIKGTIYAGIEEIYPIKSPRIINIERNIIDEHAILSFQFEDVNATQQFIATKSGILFKDDKKLLALNKWSSSQYICNGDILKVNHSISINLPRKELQIFKSLI